MTHKLQERLQMAGSGIFLKENITAQKLAIEYYWKGKSNVGVDSWSRRVHGSQQNSLLDCCSSQKPAMGCALIHSSLSTTFKQEATEMSCFQQEGRRKLWRSKHQMAINSQQLQCTECDLLAVPPSTTSWPSPQVPEEAIVKSIHGEANGESQIPERANTKITRYSWKTSTMKKNELNATKQKMQLPNALRWTSKCLFFF